MAGQKILSVGVPCYNSAEYMDHCIQSLVDAASDQRDIEIIIVNDGSQKDNTAEKADEWVRRHPDMIVAVHQENGGHGAAVMAALERAQGRYFRVVDSDDWVDVPAMQRVLDRIRHFIRDDQCVDLIVSNYVYEHANDNAQVCIHYRNTLPQNRIFTWEESATFSLHENLLMHALTYRTEMVRSCNLPMPRHTFYVDNIYAYVPLPHVETLWYEDVDLYRYFIGREDQSVNERVMLSRLDHQLRVTRIMIDSYHIYDEVKSERLQKYMVSYIAMIMAVSSIFCRMSDDPDAIPELKELWRHLEQFDKKMYRQCRTSFLGWGSNLPGKLSIPFYRVARHIFKFN